MATKSLKAAMPEPLRNGLAIALDVLHIRKRIVDAPMGFDPATGLPVDVAIYFSDDMSRAYQLIQWLPVLESHPSDLTFAIVVRKMSVYLELKEITKLPIAHVPAFTDLMELYRTSSFKAVIYVNNGVANFQSLAVAELVHIHINHGESDKICMVSNQVKAYDRVFVAGQAAVLRHRAALSEFNEDVLVRIGRPQLDENPATTIPESSRRTVLYAPTWTGEDEANNYTSMEFMGPRIIDAILAQDDVRVIYKPHPRVIDAEDQRIRKNHAHVLRAIKQASAKDSNAGHQVQESGDILAIFPRVDLLISDVSSIALDFLYLRTEAPIILTDRRNDIDQMRIDSPLSVATPVLTEDNIQDATKIIRQVLSSDDFEQDRKVLREFYFDNVQAGESAPRFYQALRDAITAHGADMARAKSLAESGTGPRFEHRS